MTGYIKFILLIKFVASERANETGAMGQNERAIVWAYNTHRNQNIFRWNCFMHARISQILKLLFTMEIAAARWWGSDGGVATGIWIIWGAVFLVTENRY